MNKDKVFVFLTQKCILFNKNTLSFCHQLCYSALNIFTLKKISVIFLFSLDPLFGGYL